MKICPRKWFCNNKKISTKIINRNNGIFYLELGFSNSISKERHIPVKNSFDPKFVLTFFQPYYVWGNDFATIKKFWPKLLTKIRENCSLYYGFRTVFLKRNIFQ